MIKIKSNLSQNIKNIYGELGNLWLSNLPILIDALIKHWHIKKIKPIDNMTYHYVAKAITENNKSVVIKIGYDKKLMLNEVNALNYFNGEGSVKLIDYNAEHNALLLEQAISGITLKSLNATKTDAIIDYYLNTMKALHRKILPKNYLYTHISDWLKALDNASPDNFPPQMLNSAINIKNKLLKTSTTQLFLHGDLHLDNILQQGNKWIAIDPKGIVGDPEFEIFAFDFIQSEDRLDSIAELIANRSGLNAQRIKEWAFVRLVLSAAWSIEDKGDPSAAIRLAEKLMNL